MKKTLKEVIVGFLEGCEDATATLKQIHEAVLESGYESKGKTLDCSERAIIYRHPETFKRLTKSIYMLVGDHSTSLIIEGDSRGLEELEEGSIACICTDHPWQSDKAHKSGNQKNFADYETFRYTQADFDAKARVLQPGGYDIEFLPIESATNYEYLYEIKQMAKKAGLEYYTSVIWRNAKEGTVNTGRCTKGVQTILILSKGKPRKLSREGIAGYQSREILNYEIEMLISANEKHHQAEKPIALYEYLIRQFTDEQDICLDQFGGSCNMAKAAVNLNRFAIVYEICRAFVKKAAARFGATLLYDPEEAPPEVHAATEPTHERITFNPFYAQDSEGQMSFAF